MSNLKSSVLTYIRPCDPERFADSKKSAKGLSSVAVACLFLSGFFGANVSAQDVSSFDHQSVEAWLATTQVEHPEVFQPNACTNQGFMQNKSERSCLMRQGLFLLGEVNARRAIGDEALRRMVGQLETERRRMAREVADLKEQNETSLQKRVDTAVRAEADANLQANQEQEIEEMRRALRAAKLENERLSESLAVASHEIEALKISRRAALSSLKQEIHEKATLARTHATLKTAYERLVSQLRLAARVTSQK